MATMFMNSKNGKTSDHQVNLKSKSKFKKN